MAGSPLSAAEHFISSANQIFIGPPLKTEERAGRNSLRILSNPVDVHSKLLQCLTNRIVHHIVEPTHRYRSTIHDRHRQAIGQFMVMHDGPPAGRATHNRQSATCVVSQAITERLKVPQTKRGSVPLIKP